MRNELKKNFLTDFSIDKESPAPLHLQIADNIRDIIVKNRIMPGVQLPYETWIAETFQINRNTVHRAYEALAEDGFLEELEGRRGIFVAESANKKYLNPFPAIGILIRGTFYDYLKNFNQYMADYLSGVIDRAAETQHSAMILNLPEIGHNPFKMDEWLNETVSRLTGIVHLGQSVSHDDLRYRKLIDYKNIPQVFVAGTSAHPNISSINSDLSSGGLALAEHLKDNGHSEVAIFAAYMNEKKEEYVFNYDSGFRSMGMLEIFRKAGLKVDDKFFVKLLDSHNDDRTAVKKFLSTRNHPNAIWCQNDVIALRIISILNEFCVRVPDDISIIGYDDIAAAADSTPPLTTIRNPSYTMGRYAIDLLIDLFKHARPGEARNVNVPASLVIRNSVGIVRRNKTDEINIGVL